jgi:hypothetical protein
MHRSLVLKSTLAILVCFANSAAAQDISPLPGPTNIPPNPTTPTYYLESDQCGVVNIGCKFGGYIPLNQFASTSNLNTSVANLNSSITNLDSLLTASMNSSVASLNASIAGLDLAMQNLKKEAWAGAALAASLTPTLPTDGNQNHINFSAATADGVQAISANFSHVDGPYDFIAAAAISRSYSLGKIGIGFSW